MYKKIFSFICLLLPLSLKAQTFSSDTLVSDFKSYVKLLQETHPDPYSNMGGKVQFYNRSEEIIDKIRVMPRGSINILTDAIRELNAQLNDGHTSVNMSNQQFADDLYAPVSVSVIPDGLILTSVPKQDAKYLGAKIIGVNGHAIEELCRKVTSRYGCENTYHAYDDLRFLLCRSRMYKRIYQSDLSSLTLEVETVDGKKAIIDFPFLAKMEADKVERSKVEHSMLQEDFPYIGYKFLDNKRNIMYFRDATVMSRDNLCYMYENHWGSLKESIADIYNNYLKKTMPDSLDNAIREIPSFTEVFYNMLMDMKQSESEYLIVDLRNNSGGWSPIVYPVLYQLYGDNYLKKNMEVTFYRLLSPLYLAKNNMTLNEFNAQNHTNHQIGDYLITKSEDIKGDIKSIRSKFIANSMSERKDLLLKQDGSPVYTPKKVFVITSSGTFSAAFHFAFYLWKMGAIVVGVPSSQAPNTYMEVTPYRLPLTGVIGSISNAVQEFLPSDNSKAKIFYPDLMPTHKDYAKNNYDGDTEVKYIIQNVIHNSQK
ncbi:MAG: peptidase [Bacteroidetes bacterium]|nr:peptidase [Bacteroidota bacterium]